MKFTNITCTNGTTFTATDGENLMARYSRVLPPGWENKGPEDKVSTQFKNTLLTLAVGDTVYFGIARCNLDAGDKFSKKEGRSRALLRLLHAREKARKTGDLSSCLNHINLMWGWCFKADLKMLLGHFFNIDKDADAARRAKYEYQGTTKKRKKQPPIGDSTVAVSP